MKSGIILSKILVVLLLNAFWTDASEAVKIEVGAAGRISGSIRNAASHQPLDCVAVTLYSAADSSMVAGTITDNDGSFVISMLKAGSYFLEISERGYETKYIAGINIRPVLPGIDMGEVGLNPGAKRRGKEK